MARPGRRQPLSTQILGGGFGDTSVAVLSNETGTGIDTSAIAAALAAGDSGSGVDSSIILILSTDAGTGVDASVDVLVVPPPPPPPPTIAEVLAGSHLSAARLLSLDGSYAVRRIWESSGAVLTDGSVTFDRSRNVRRTGTATLANADGSLSPADIADPFWTGQVFRLERGALVAGAMSWVTMATLVVTRFATTMAGALALTGEDPTWLLQQPMGEATTLPASTPAEDAVLALCAGYLPPGTTWDLDGAGRTVGTDRSWTESDMRLDAVSSLMADLGLELFADRMGAIVLRPVPDPALMPVARVIDRLPGTATILEMERASDRLPYNRQVVVSETGDAAQPVYRAVAEVTDPASPIHSSRVGVRAAPLYTSAQVPDQAAANAVAANMLRLGSLVSDGVSGRFLPDPLVDEWDAVQAREATSGTDARYVVDQVTHPLLDGPMSLTTSRVVGIDA